MEKFDCVVVGAGWYGLGAAGQFRRLAPECSLLVLDGQSSLGGTWADERLYLGLKSNNLLGTYEYPDFPMSSDRFNIKRDEHIPGETIHAYLKAYAAFAGIADAIRLETRVLSAEHQDTPDGGWILTVACPGTGAGEEKIFAARLIVATGLTSEAFLPHFDGQETFGGEVFHIKDFRTHRDTLKTAKSVTVFGGTKSSWDAAYAYATAGVKVNWVIRSSGHGPCWIAPPYVTPFKKWIEKLSNMRFLTWFSPCIWGDVDGYGRIRSLLHGTAAGRFLVDSFWKILGGDVMTLNKYDSHPDTAKLKPWTEAMFTGASFSILNYDQDILELVKSDLIDVHVGELDHLSPGVVHLADGTTLQSDVLVANTGWKHVPPMKFLPEGIEREIGIPHELLKDAPSGDLGNQRKLIELADGEILRRFPRLKNQPVWNKDYVPLTNQKGIETADEVTPYTPLTAPMLYRFIVPPSARFLRRRDLAFTGTISNFSNSINAHVIGLWISAYFFGELTDDPAASADGETALQALQYETVLFSRFGRWRYPTDWGSKNPSFIFDAVPFLDLLMRDLGLNSHRKNGWFAEITDPYGPEDYQDVTDEWLRKHKIPRQPKTQE